MSHSEEKPNYFEEIKTHNPYANLSKEDMEFLSVKSKLNYMKSKKNEKKYGKKIKNIEKWLEYIATIDEGLVYMSFAEFDSYAKIYYSSKNYVKSKVDNLINVAKEYSNFYKNKK